MALDPKKQQMATAFLTGLLQHVPEANRAAATELFQSLGNVEQAAEHVAAHLLRQEDYSRVMNEGQSTLQKKQQELDGLISTMRQTRDEQKTWWETNRAALSEWEKLKAQQPNGDGTDDDADPDDDGKRRVTGLTREQVEEILNKRDPMYVAVLEGYVALNNEHQRAFGEHLTQADFERIRQHPRISELGIVGAWRDTYREQFDQKAAEARQAEEAKWKAEGRKEAEAAFAQRQGPPYAVPGSPTAPIDILLQPDQILADAKKATAPEAMALEYLNKVKDVSPDDSGWVGV